MKDRFISLEEVKRRVNRGRATIYTLMAKGQFPKKYKNGWLESDIDQYIDDVVKAANDGHDQAAA